MENHQENVAHKNIEPPMFLDELGFYAFDYGPKQQKIIAALRSDEAIPNATYFVKNAKEIFVFDKLVELVDEQYKMHPDRDIIKLAHALMDQAFVSPQEAVEQWHIVPFPYMAEPVKNGWIIVHRPFNAVIPRTFKDEAELHKAFIQLLVGKKVLAHGKSDFLYKGQPMRLRTSFKVADLPFMPHVAHLADHNDMNPYLSLGDISYHAGFAPISEKVFHDVKEREETWVKHRLRVAHYVEIYADKVWSQIKKRPSLLKKLIEDTDHVPEDGGEIVQLLRKAYPELAIWEDGTLYAWYEAYQVTYYDSCDMEDWSVHRENDFLFFLLGERIIRQNDDTSEVIQAGKWLAYALLRGDTIANAVHFAKAAFAYGKALFTLSEQVKRVITFLEQENHSVTPHGGPVTTMSDIFDWARQGSSSNPMHMEQTI